MDPLLAFALELLELDLRRSCPPGHAYALRPSQMVVLVEDHAL